MRKISSFSHFVMLSAIAAAIFMASCIKDEVVDVPFIPTESETIGFGVASDWGEYEDVTRSGVALNRIGKHELKSADGEFTLPMGVYVEDGIRSANADKAETRGAVLGAIGNSFTVWASLANGDTSTLFFDAQVEVFEDDGTSYKSDPAYFWPGAGTLNFTAVANAPASGFVPNLNTAGTALESFTYTVPQDATAQNDIVLATESVGGANNATVPLNFKHIMTAVNVQIGAVSAGTIKSITLKGVYNKGSYNVDTNKWTVDTSSTADYSVKFAGGGDSFTTTGTQTSGTAINADNATFMFIPQEPGAGAVMEIVFNNGDRTETLTGKIEGDIWDKGKTVNYKLSIDKDFTLKVEPDPTAKKLDAHYIITDVFVTVAGNISNWKISASADDGEKVTIIPYDEANPLAQQGFWTDVVVDENGNETETSARGESEYPGSGSVTEKRFLVFIPENISDKDRQITITLSSTDTGSTASSTKILLQKYPNWTGDIGWEVVDDDERGKYGFKWTREVSYVWPYSYTHTLGIGTNYSRSAATEELNKIVSPYTNGQTLSLDFTNWQNQFISLGEFHHTGSFIKQDRAFIYLNYTVLNNIVQSEDKRTNGYANTETLYTSGGTASSLALELAIQTTVKTKGDDAGALAFSKVTNGDSYSSKSVYDASPATNIPYEKGTLDDLSGILSYILKKNRYCLQIIETENGYSQHAYFQIKDLKWFLPAVDEFPTDVDFTPENTTDSAADYWSSTTAGTSTAYIGSGAEKDRDLEFAVIATRVNENGYGTVAVTVDNSEMAGGENGEAQWVN